MTHLPESSARQAPADARPTQILMSEHRLIERGLECLETMATRARDDATLVVADASELLRFIEEFADAGHHAKEETHLFPAMEARGLPSHAGPTAVMRAEHEEGRAHVRAMSRAVLCAPADLEVFARHALAFVSLLRQHIMKEDQILFPMADGMIAPETHEELRATFAKMDASFFGAEGWTPHVSSIERLEGLYSACEGSPGVGPGSPGCGGCV